MNNLLRRWSVLEAGQSPAVRYCGRLLALSGATVERIPGSPDSNGSKALEDYLNHSKCIQGEPGTSRKFDIVIADPAYDWESVGPWVVTGTVDPFSHEGSRAHWTPSEMVLASVGGSTNYTFASDGVPVYGFGRRFQYLAGAYLYTAIVSLLGVDSPVRPLHPRVRVANDEVVTALLPYGTTQYAYNGTATTIEQSGPRFVASCVDGYLCVYAGGAWANQAELLGDLVDSEDPRFTDIGSRFAHADELDELIQKWAANRTMSEAVEAADAASVAVAPCYDLADALADTSLFENGVLTREHVDDREVVLAGLGYHVREAP